MKPEIRVCYDRIADAYTIQRVLFRDLRKLHMLGHQALVLEIRPIPGGFERFGPWVVKDLSAEQRSQIWSDRNQRAVAMLHETSVFVFGHAVFEDLVHSLVGAIVPLRPTMERCALKVSEEALHSKVNRLIGFCQHVATDVLGRRLVIGGEVDLAFLKKVGDDRNVILHSPNRHRIDDVAAGLTGLEEIADFLVELAVMCIGQPKPTLVGFNAEALAEIYGHPEDAIRSD